MSTETNTDKVTTKQEIEVKVEEVQKNGDGDAPVIEEDVKADTEGLDGKGKRIHPSGKTMIVRNMPASMLFTYEEELRKLFSKYGQITYVKRGGIPIYFDTVEPTLTAYVNFESTESSDAALAERGTMLGGNPIEIDILRAGEHTVVVNNLPYVIAKECLHRLLSPCGAIKDIVKIPARPTAFVEFEDEEGAKKALSLTGSLLINNMQVVLQRRGQGQEAPQKKNKKNAPPSKRGNPAGGKRGGRGGIGRGGGPRNQPIGGGYNTWDGGPPLGFRGPRNFGGNAGSMSYNNWGNGNFRDNTMDERPFKRRKQNDWSYQY